jgi:acetylglutamate kinase
VRILIKVGGTLLDRDDTRRSLAAQLAQAAMAHELVIVHGGGKQVTRFLEERGISSWFSGGLRVSDAAVIDAVVNVIAGGVNKTLVAALIASGAKPVGLSGVDSLTRAVQLNPELGFVGKPEATDGRLLRILLSDGYLPVIGCIAVDQRGNIYNVNADQMAVSCALGWPAEKLIFLTDVPGLKLAAGTIARHVADRDVSQLVASGVATGGMQAKLEACATAIAAGLSEVIIAPGDVDEVIGRVLAGEELGTRIAAGVMQHD